MNKSRIIKLFDAYARNLANVEKTSDMDRIRCPLCLKYFNRDDISNGRLSEEHIIPKAVGGNYITTITCKVCNNRQGSRLDSQIVGSANARAFLTGKHGLPSRIDIGNVHFSANLFIKPGPKKGFKFVVVDKASDQRQVDESKKLLRTGTNSFNVRVSLGYNQNRLWLGLLRIAYLNSFRVLGYNYILHPSVSEIRRQINSEDPPSTDLEKIIISIQLEYPIEESIKLLDLWSSVNLPAYLTIIQFYKKEIETYFVLIPCAETRPVGSIIHLAEVADTLKSKPMTISFYGKDPTQPATQADVQDHESNGAFISK